VLTGYLAAHLARAGGGRPKTTLATLAVLHGYTTAFWWAAGILTAGAIICGTLLRRGVLAGQGDSGPHDAPAPEPEVSRSLRRIAPLEAGRVAASATGGSPPARLSRPGPGTAGTLRAERPADLATSEELTWLPEQPMPTVDGGKDLVR
jgi:hypothetical protein